MSLSCCRSSRLFLAFYCVGIGHAWCIPVKGRRLTSIYDQTISIILHLSLPSSPSISCVSGLEFQSDSRQVWIIYTVLFIPSGRFFCMFKSIFLFMFIWIVGSGLMFSWNRSWRSLILICILVYFRNWVLFVLYFCYEIWGCVNCKFQ